MFLAGCNLPPKTASKPKALKASMEPAFTYHFGLMPCSSKLRSTLMQSRWPRALLVLKAEITAECMASGGSKFLLIIRKEWKQGLRHNHGSNQVSCTDLLSKDFSESCTSVLPCYPSRALAWRSLWKSGATIMKLPALFLWSFLPCSTAAAFVTTCFLLTALDWPKPGPTKHIWPDNN